MRIGMIQETPPDFLQAPRDKPNPGRESVPYKRDSWPSVCRGPTSTYPHSHQKANVLSVVVKMEGSGDPPANTTSPEAGSREVAEPPREIAPPDDHPPGSS